MPRIAVFFMLITTLKEQWKLSKEADLASVGTNKVKSSDLRISSLQLFHGKTEFLNLSRDRKKKSMKLARGTRVLQHRGRAGIHAGVMG